MLRAVWNFRFFVLAAIWADFQARYARSKLGLAWSVLNPLAMAAVFALVFSKMAGIRIAASEEPRAYAIYLLAGVSAWSLFADVFNRCLTVFIDYANMMKKIAFPRLCLPLIVLGTALVNHVFLLLATALMAVMLGYPPAWTWIAVPFALVPIALFALGLGVTLGIFNVFARDVGQISALALQLWFWMTPIVYAPSALSDGLRALLALNPLTALVAAYQDCLLFDRWPSAASLMPPWIVALCFVSLGLFLFRRASAELVDAL